MKKIFLCTLSVERLGLAAALAAGDVSSGREYESARMATLSYS